MMTPYKKLIPGFGCKEGKAVSLNWDNGVYEEGILSLARSFGDTGADELLFYDLSVTDQEHETAIGLLKEAVRSADVPILAGGRVKRLEDVKKYLYAGAKAVFLDVSNDDNVDLMKEASDRFGDDKIYAWLPDESYLPGVAEYTQLGASVMMLGNGGITDDGTVSEAVAAAVSCSEVPFLLTCPAKDTAAMVSLLSMEGTAGVLCRPEIPSVYDCMEIKQKLRGNGISIDTYETSIPWNQLKLNGDGMIPVIVQDYRTQEVLMMAYMNEEAYETTIRTGRMTYYSRSRSCLWLKGETSGHYQYLKELSLDCDNDTILAKVNQIGAACHTGARSCFFQTLVKKEYNESNPLKVFEEVFHVIEDRKEHPKEGSYTNYLFDKGIDKILKKVGEEATEIVIAAKNPDPEEVKYEISDFLYHVMVLMAEKGVTWEDITKELANR